jgi:hypothetical protein
MEDNSTPEEGARDQVIEINAHSVKIYEETNGDLVVQANARIKSGLLKPSCMVDEDGRRLNALAGKLTGPVQVRLSVVSWALQGGGPGEER